MIVFIRKYFPSLYKSLSKSIFLNDFLSFFYLLKTILKKEKNLFLFYLKNTFFYYFLKKRDDITFMFHGNKIVMPRHLKGLDGFIEVWSDKFYDKIQGFDNVLDIGGYIGDSALKFAQNNKKVTVYEAHPDNFKYLKMNTKNFNNVKIFNIAVTGNKNIKELKFYGGNFNMGAGTGNSQNTEKGFITVPAISIVDILNNNEYDALKMDIEGAEYDCLDAIIENDCKFNFKRGFIEFHLSKNKEQYLNKIENYIKHLERNKYKLEYYDVFSNVYFNDLNNLQHDVFLIYFETLG